jgi:hypothetical protein
MTGNAFAPLLGQHPAGAFLLTDRQLKSAEALRRLVEIGPEALPHLLDALGDETPTKLKVDPKGAMWFANELWGNPLNPTERRVLSARPRVPPGKEERVPSYTLKVGDVCLVAVGQIVGRPYRAARYQPTAGIVVNSPTHDQELREQLRAPWASKDPARNLLDALLTDYATEAVYQDGKLGKLTVASGLQCGAALRLLYYFPKETAPVIAARLRSFDVRDPGGPGFQGERKGLLGQLDRWREREAANGVRTDDFLKAVCWSKEPAIQEALADIGRRSDDRKIQEALPGGLRKAP